MSPRLDVIEAVIHDIAHAIECQHEDVTAAEIVSAVFTVLRRMLPVVLAGAPENRPLLLHTFQLMLMECAGEDAKKIN